MLKEFKKGVAVQITPHFKSTEFDCNCSYPECQSTIVELDHVEFLEKKRVEWQKSVQISSGFRCERRNKDEGGATLSQHPKGTATDIKVIGMTPEQVAKSCDDRGGVGIYDTFTHVDSRVIPLGRAKARWDFRRK